MERPSLGNDLRLIFTAITGPGFPALCFVMLLMILNWGLEAVKWRMLISPVQKVSLIVAFKAVLAGLSLAMNTPNRTGEYFGRVVFMPGGTRLQGVALTLAGSFAQTLITLSMGVLAIFWLHEDIFAAFGWRYPLPVFVAAMCILLIFCIFCWLLFFRIGSFSHWISQWKWMAFLRKHVVVLESMGKRMLLTTLGLSWFRYLVFVLQYVLILYGMGIDAEWLMLSGLVAVFFLLMMLSPTIALLELGLRWQFSLILFGLVSQDAVAILAAGTAIWLINLAVPALLGAIFMAGSSIFNKKKSNDLIPESVLHTEASVVSGSPIQKFNG